MKGQYGSRYVAAADVSRIYGWKLSYVYRQASRNGWPKIRVDGEVRYLREAVQATFDGGSEGVEVKTS